MSVIKKILILAANPKSSLGCFFQHYITIPAPSNIEADKTLERIYKLGEQKVNLRIRRKT